MWPLYSKELQLYDVRTQHYTSSPTAEIIIQGYTRNERSNRADMKLDDNFTVTNDAYSWTLHLRREGDINPKTGKPSVCEKKWHFGNLKDCLRRYLDESLKPAESVEEMRDLLHRAMAHIDQHI